MSSGRESRRNRAGLRVVTVLVGFATATLAAATGSAEPAARASAAPAVQKRSAAAPKGGVARAARRRGLVAHAGAPNYGPRRGAAGKPEHATGKPEHTAAPAKPEHSVEPAHGHGRRPIRVAARAPVAKADPRTEPSRAACLGQPVGFDRAGLEPQALPLLDCKGAPLPKARALLTVLARPLGLGAAPAVPHVGARGRAAAAANEQPLLDAGLLTRLDALGKHFPGRAVSLISGYRPDSPGSLHHAGRALDFRVSGVDNQELAAFCRSLPDTGCGYYPNSAFVHLDVRSPGSGSVYWIDAAGTGEPPRYVREWPPPRSPKGAAKPSTSGSHDEGPNDVEPDQPPVAPVKAPAKGSANDAAPSPRAAVTVASSAVGATSPKLRR